MSNLLNLIGSVGLGLTGAYQMQRQSERDKIEHERFGMEKERFGREQDSHARQQQMRKDYEDTMGQIVSAANSAAKIQQGLSSGKLTESDALLQGVEAYNAFTTDPRKMAVAPDGKSVQLYSTDGKVESVTSAKDALATMLSPQGADHVLMSGYQRLAEKYPEYADKWQAVFRDLRNSARQERRDDRAERRLTQQDAIARERLDIDRENLGMSRERLGLARNADARAQQRLEAGDRPKGLTPTQERSNAEIDAAREAVAGLSPEEIKKLTTKAMDSGRDNPHYDNRIAQATRLAGRRKVGDDPWFDKREGQQPAAPTIDRADVAKRFRSDRAMDSYTLGRDTPDGVEVLQKGKVVGHYR